MLRVDHHQKASIMTSRIVLKNVITDTWQWIDEPLTLPAKMLRQLAERGVSQGTGILFIDLDHSAADAIELDEEKELGVCEWCGCLEPRGHACEVAP